jgi:S1-C subfamily serine protease
VRQIAAGVRPAVVQITNEQVQVGKFNQPFTVPSGVGSGVLFGSQGHILTNAHVVEGARQLLVLLPDGRSFPGTLVGSGPQTDLAVLQITGDNLPQAALGNSQELQVGDWVVAIGNALAQLSGGPTVTQGGGQCPRAERPGAGHAEGGPLDTGPHPVRRDPDGCADPPWQFWRPAHESPGPGYRHQYTRGRAGRARRAGARNWLGDRYRHRQTHGRSALASGHAIHPFLGISFVALNPAIDGQLGAQASSGAVVVQVAQGSPAAASQQPRDVIIQVNGKALSSDTDLARAINTHHPGDVPSLGVVRADRQLTLNLTLAERPA